MAAMPECDNRTEKGPGIRGRRSGARGGAGGPGAHLFSVCEVIKHGTLSSIVSVGCGDRSKLGGASGGPFLQYAPPCPDRGAGWEARIPRVSRVIKRGALSCSGSVGCEERPKSGDASGGSFLQYASRGRTGGGVEGRAAMERVTSFSM